MLADAAHCCSPAGIKEVGVQSWNRLLYFSAAPREAQCPACSSELHWSVCCFKSTPICQLQNHSSLFFPVLIVIFQPSPCQHVAIRNRGVMKALFPVHAICSHVVVQDLHQPQGALWMSCSREQQPNPTRIPLAAVWAEWRGSAISLLRYCNYWATVIQHLPRILELLFHFPPLAKLRAKKLLVFRSVIKMQQKAMIPGRINPWATRWSSAWMDQRCCCTLLHCCRSCSDGQRMHEDLSCKVAFGWPWTLAALSCKCHSPTVLGFCLMQWEQALSCDIKYLLTVIY